MPLKAKNLFFNAEEHDKLTSPALFWQMAKRSFN
jgi:hypothetical protein